MINSVVLVGRLGADPELSYTQSGTAICKFRLAVDRPPRKGSDDHETDWLNVVCFDRQAETAHQYLDKGALAGVEGRVQSRTWERDDGSRAYAVEINAYRVAFLESRRDREARQANGGPPQGARPDDAPPQPQQQQAAIDWTLDEDEDPFGER
jgi:single-strand DNA-binding protein